MLPIIVAPEILVNPSSVTVFSGSTTELICRTKNADQAYWKLNETILARYNGPLPLLNDTKSLQEHFQGGISTVTLTIKARTEYHGLVIQCVAVVFGGGPEVESENATLMVQGTVELRLVGYVDNMYTDLIHPLPVQVCWIQ